MTIPCRRSTRRRPLFYRGVLLMLSPPSEKGAIQPITNLSVLHEARDYPQTMLFLGNRMLREPPGDQMRGGIHDPLARYGASTAAQASMNSCSSFGNVSAK
jgi:hypothetical protein